MFINLYKKKNSFKFFVLGLRLWEIPVAEYRTAKLPWMREIPDYQTEVQEWDEKKNKICTGC